MLEPSLQLIRRGGSTSERHDGEQEGHRIYPITLPPNLESQIDIPSAFLSRDRLVFLDQNFWVCSWRLPLPSNAAFRRPSAAMDSGILEIKRHYFLPGDWISPDCVVLCTVMANGTMLCPRNGEVAVVKCSSLGA